MADNLTVARPYARALFAKALDTGVFDDWQAVLDAFSMIVGELASQHIIGNPNVSHEQLFALCFDSIKQVVDVKADFEGELKRFVELVLYEGRLTIVPEITVLYHDLVNAHNRLVEADVISAAALSDGERRELIASLEKRFNSKVTAHYSEDPSLIGGLVVKSNGWVFDGSIRSKLTRLAERII